MTFFPSVIETWESTRVSNGCETCLNTDLKLEHYSVKHSSSITSGFLLESESSSSLSRQFECGLLYLEISTL